MGVLQPVGRGVSGSILRLLPRFEALAQSVTLPIWKSLGYYTSRNNPHENAPLMVSQMLREAFAVSAVISLKSFMCASVAGPAIPSVTSPFFC